jgi:hypothetical protein
MKVAELIMLLEDMDQDAEVFIEDVSSLFDILLLDMFEASDGVVMNVKVFAKTDKDEFLQ